VTPDVFSFFAEKFQGRDSGARDPLNYRINPHLPFLFHPESQQERLTTSTRTRTFSLPPSSPENKKEKEKPRMTSDNPLPTPPSASASASATPTPASSAAVASGSQTADPAAGTGADPAATGQQTSPAAQQQQQQQQQQQPSPAEVIEALLQQVLASNDDAALAGTLLNSLGTSDLRESILSSLTPAAADPLDALDAARHTIGCLFILCVLVSLSLLSPPPTSPLPGAASLLC